MFMAVREPQAISVRHIFTALVAAGVIQLAAQGAWAQVSCEDCDQCMTNCVCQADGSCGGGVPKPNGTACDDGNDCTTVDTCQSGQCVGGSPKNAGDPCTIPGLGKCVSNTVCQSVPFVGITCLPANENDFVQCPNCELCDPNTGECTIPMPCGEDPCSTGECDSSTGECIPGNEGAPCDDGNVCTTNDQCQSGECVGTAGGTPGPTPTPTPPSVSGCVGDCNNDGVVTIGEIITGIDIALGNADVSECENFDANDDGLVTVDEILTAVNNALDGCPEVPATATPRPTNTSLPMSTPTPPATATPTTHITGTVPPTQTPAPTTPGASTPSIGTRAAGTIESTTSALMVIPNLMAAIIGQLPGAGSGGSASPLPIPTISFKCGGTPGGNVACDQSITGLSVSPPTYTVTFNNCQLSGTSGTLTINGTVTVADQVAEVCFSAAPTLATVTAQNLTIQMPNGTTATFSGFSATIALSCSSSPCSCVADTVTLIPTGTITVVSGSTTTVVTFGAGSSISISVDTYNSQCVPTVYDMEVDGNITLTTNGATFAATYYGYDIYDDASSGNDMVDIEGSVESACFGDTVDFSTSTDIALGNPCPSAGVVDAYEYTSGNTDEITYSSSGVHIDFEAGGSADFQSCLDPRLFVCPAS
jgi:hypothetical protein